MCEHETERHEWRADVLDFIRNHVEAEENYRLGAVDLEFGELLPAKPGTIEQAEYEERTAVGFNLERLTKRLGELPWSGFCAPRSATYEPTPGYTVTRVDVEDGPGIIRIDRTDEAE